MRVADILRVKGSEVVTCHRDEGIRTLLRLLSEHGIGAVVVVDDSDTLVGIISERDIARALADRGDTSLDGTVGDYMTTEVATAGLATTVIAVVREMTFGRFRHMPVLDGGRLVGLVSIGDVVKSRISELELERESLIAYVASSRT